MSRAIKLFLLTFVLLLGGSNVYAWQFYDGDDLNQLHEGIVILDPDKWSRVDLEQMKLRGIRPVAWLNLTQIETSRIIPFDMRERDYTYPRRLTREGKPLARFYSSHFRRLVLDRLREYAVKGFDGILLARVYNYDEISDSHINRPEMWSLVIHLAQQARLINPNIMIIVHDNGRFSDLIAQESIITGSLIEGLFNCTGGRHIHSIDRENRIKSLGPLFTAAKLVLSAETSNTHERINYARQTGKKLNVVTGFTQLPLIMERTD